MYQIFWMGALAWLAISLAGTLPIYLIATGLAAHDDFSLTYEIFANGLNAVFESFSGFTSTGLTMAAGHESSLPASLQWWRSLTQWIGGLGFISLVLMYIQPTYRSMLALETELDEQEFHKDPHIMSSHIWGIYLFLTALSIVLFAWHGLNMWEAINYGMTGIATRGFGIRDDSMASFSLSAQICMMLIMVLGAINFAVHDKIYHCSFRSLLKDRQFLWYLIGLVVLLCVMTFARHVSVQKDIVWTDMAFHAISAAASAGFSTSERSEWPASLILILVLAMIIGGCKGSTAGGIKISRLRAFVRLIFHFLRETRRRPDILFTFKGEKVEAELTRETYQAIALIFLWGLTGMAGIFALSFSLNANMGDIIFETYSALGCVGLSSGLTQPDMPASGKLTLIALMWLGRLEIIPIFAFVLTPFYRER